MVGEPGVGKSRLFREFIHSHRTQDWMILESGSVSYGKATSYLPVLDLLKGYFKITDRDSHRNIRAKVTGAVVALDRALEPALPPILALLDIPVEDSQWTDLDAAQRRRRTLDAIKRLLLRESQVQPLLVVFEDLHWIDAETQALLDSLVESLPAAHLLLLVNYRPEYRHSWGSKTYYTQLRLDTLPHESTEEFLRSILGMDRTLDALKGLVTARTGGNPLFLEESVRTLVETQALVGQRGAYRLARPLEAIEVPATVQAILAARVDRLPPEEKQFLQAAAVIGNDVPFPLLREITEEPEERLRQRLAHLQTAEFLYEASLFPDLEYTFKHALTHEVVYRGLLHDRRRALHAQVAEAIETLYQDRLPEQVERLAHHMFRGEMWENAARCLREAGWKAFGRGADREAASYYEQALEALRHLPETRDRLEQAIDLRFDLRSAVVSSDRLGIITHLRAAEALATRLGDRRRLGWVLGHMSFATIGPEARALAERALEIGESLGDVGLRVVSRFYLGQACFLLGDFRRAAVRFGEVIELLDAGDLRRARFGQNGFPAVSSRGSRSLAYQGEFDKAIACGQEGLQIAGRVPPDVEIDGPLPIACEA